MLLLWCHVCPNRRLSWIGAPVQPVLPVHCSEVNCKDVCWMRLVTLNKMTHLLIATHAFMLQNTSENSIRKHDSLQMCKYWHLNARTHWQFYVQVCAFGAPDDVSEWLKLSPVSGHTLKPTVDRRSSLLYNSLPLINTTMPPNWFHHFLVTLPSLLSEWLRRFFRTGWSNF